MTELESLLAFVNDLLSVDTHPDHARAHNGLQVAGPPEVGRLAVAVDASREVVEAAVAWDADLLLVHHGLFWGGGAPLTGRLYERVAGLIRGDVGLYSVHLPLDAHPELGNCALLGDALGWEREGRFGSHEGAPVGWRGRMDPVEVEALGERLARVVEGPVQHLGGGPERVESIAVVTGAGGSFLDEAVAGGIHALVTGEAPHHVAVDAREAGLHVLCGGHYATETFGVRALGARLAREFDLAWTFLDFPTGV